VKVRHRITINSKCPVNGDADHYTADVFVAGLLYCEKVRDAVADLTREPVTQEVLTQQLADRLGCKVRTRGTHGTHCQGLVESVVVCWPTVPAVA